MGARSTRSVSINNLITSPTRTSPTNFHSPSSRSTTSLYSPTVTHTQELGIHSRDLVSSTGVDLYSRETVKEIGHHEGGRMPLDNMLHGPVHPPRPSIGTYPYPRRPEPAPPGYVIDDFNCIEIPSLHVPKIMWPLKDPKQADLLRHYISYISKWVSIYPIIDSHC